jgi:hypothetical protein
MHNLQQDFSTTTHTYIIISDLEEEEEKLKTTKLEVFQLAKFEQLVEFSIELVQEGLFEVFELVPSITHFVVPIEEHFKCMMRRKRNEVMEENDYPTNVTHKRTPIERKEI